LTEHVVFSEIRKKGNVLTVSTTAAHATNSVDDMCGAFRGFNNVYWMGVC
jgi:hypothetical protein